MPSPADYLTRKTSVPSDMRSAEWSRYVDAQLRERSFFMAAVSDAATLAQFRSVIEQVARGEIGRDEARKRLRMALDKAGYQPTAGTEDTIKDLRTNQRLRVSVDTNVDLAAGWARRQQLIGDPYYPALELYRAGRARAPRDWQTRWAEAAAAVGNKGVALNGAMIALIESPIWAKLSAFDQPYPPFDYGSHMRTRAVDAIKCEQITFGGAEPAEETLPPSAEAPREEVLDEPSLNCDTSVDASRFDAQTLAELDRMLQGFAKVQDGRLMMTDPNGTRPCSAEEVGKVIAEPLPSGFRNLQRDAFEEWADDPTRFDPRTAPTDDRASLDTKEDVARLFRRIIPETQTCHRGLSFESEDELADFLESAKERGYGARPGRVAESWTSSAEAAQGYAAQGKVGVEIIYPDCHVFRPLRGLYDSISDGAADARRAAEGVLTPDARMDLVPSGHKTVNGVLVYQFTARPR